MIADKYTTIVILVLRNYVSLLDAVQTYSGNQSGILWHGIKMNQKRDQNFENTLFKQTTLYSVLSWASACPIWD